MSGTTERDLETAQLRVDQECAAGVTAIARNLANGGATDCVDCSDEIEPARKRALPSADRCLSCQTFFEGR